MYVQYVQGIQPNIPACTRFIDIYITMVCLVHTNTMVRAHTSIAIAIAEQTIYVYERTIVSVFSERTRTLFQQPRRPVPFNLFAMRTLIKIEIAQGTLLHKIKPLYKPLQTPNLGVIVRNTKRNSCYKLVQGFRVTCFITGQYNTKGYGTITGVI